jgi:hypothetical protein
MQKSPPFLTVSRPAPRRGMPSLCSGPCGTDCAGLGGPHQIAQDDTSAEDAWVDAWLHRMEGDSGNARGRFTERIRALAANQDLLVRHEWQRIDVQDLAQVQLGHFADLIGPRINLDGPKLHLNAAAAQAIGLALHELATNAGKIRRALNGCWPRRRELAP